MSQRTFGWDSEKSDEISKTEAISYMRAYSRRLKLVRRISVNGFSSWPSPIVNRTTKSNGHKGFSTLFEEAVNWATPNVPNRGKEMDKSHRPESGGIDLQSQTEIWATPAATDFKRGSEMPEKSLNRKKGKPKILNYEAAQWASPRAHDFKGGGENTPENCFLDRMAENFQLGLPSPETETDGDTSSEDGPNLLRPSEMWRSPTAGTPNSTRGNCNITKETREEQGHTVNIQHQVASWEWPTPVAQDDQKSPEAHMAMKQNMKGGPRNKATSLTVVAKQETGKKKLNPLFVNWIMCWPLAWSIASIPYAPAEMELYRSRLRRLFFNYLQKLSR